MFLKLKTKFVAEMDGLAWLYLVTLIYSLIRANYLYQQQVHWHIWSVKLWWKANHWPWFMGGKGVHSKSHSFRTFTREATYMLHLIPHHFTILRILNHPRLWVVVWLDGTSLTYFLPWRLFEVHHITEATNIVGFFSISSSLWRPIWKMNVNVFQCIQ